MNLLSLHDVTKITRGVRPLKEGSKITVRTITITSHGECFGITLFSEGEIVED